MTKRKGLSLIEILIFMGISSVAGILLVSIMIQNNSLFFKESIKVSQGLSLNDASREINDSIRGASLVPVSYVDGSTTYTSGVNTIVLKVPSIDSSGNAIANTYDHVVITQDSQNTKILRKRLFPDAASARGPKNQVLATSLSLISFSYFNDTGNPVSPTQATKINYIMNVLDKIGALDTQTASSSSEVNLRNN